MDSSSEKGCYRCGSTDVTFQLKDGELICISCIPDQADSLKIERYTKEGIEQLYRESSLPQEKPITFGLGACYLCGSKDNIFDTKDKYQICSSCVPKEMIKEDESNSVSETTKAGINKILSKAAVKETPEKKTPATAPKTEKPRSESKTVPKAELKKTLDISNVLLCEFCGKTAMRAKTADSHSVCSGCMKKAGLTGPQEHTFKGIENEIRESEKNKAKKPVAASKPKKKTSAITPKKAGNLLFKMFKVGESAFRKTKKKK